MKKTNDLEQEETVDDKKVNNYLSFIASADARMSSMLESRLPIYGYLGPHWWPPLPPLPLPLDGGLWPWCIWRGVATGPCSPNPDGWIYRDGEQIIPGAGADSEADLKWWFKHAMPDDFEQPCDGVFIFEYHENFENAKGYDELVKSGKFGSYISGFLKIVNIHAISKLEELAPCIDPCHPEGTIIGHRIKQLDGRLETVTRVSVVCTR